MAASAHGTLTANTVTTVQVIASRRGIEVVNRSMSGQIWVRFDGVDPVVAADGAFCVLGARSFPTNAGTLTVSLIANEALDFSVEAA